MNITKLLLIYGKKKKHKHHHHHHQTDEKILLENAKGLNDEEMNSLYYEEALVIDKRSYFQYYLSLIKKWQIANISNNHG